MCRKAKTWFSMGIQGPLTIYNILATLENSWTTCLQIAPAWTLQQLIDSLSSRLWVVKCNSKDKLLHSKRGLPFQWIKWPLSPTRTLWQRKACKLIGPINRCLITDKNIFPPPLAFCLFPCCWRQSIYKSILTGIDTLFLRCFVFMSNNGDKHSAAHVHTCH